MTESEAFLQAIWERPEDDAPRLVYADWLEERGDPHGEFIHTQIALTRGGRDRHQELGLRQRERELLERFGPAWAEPVVRQGLTPWFRRGFRQPVERAKPPHRQPRPRVQILYPWRVGGLTLSRELPYVVGVLADLSGQRREGRPPLPQRPFLSVDGRSFDAVLARIRPELHLEIPGGPAGQSPPRRVDLHFERLADFEPARLAERVPELRELLPDRQREAVAGAAPDRLAALDRQLSVHLAAVLHHPDFQRLESTWRGLHYLVRQTVTGEDLKIRVLDVTKRELFKDLEKAAEFDQSTLFKKIYEEEYGHVDGEPYGLLVGDYEFGHSEEDISLLARIAQVAAAAHAPFIAAASPKMFNMDRFDQLPKMGDLARIFEGVEYDAWKSFRDMDDSRYVALTLPRVRARLPHGQDHAHAGVFPFEEFVDGEDHARCLWMSAAWAYAAKITDVFRKYGWFARTRGVSVGGRVEGLPVGISPADSGDLALKCPTEIAISIRREYQLSVLGFLPLFHTEDTDIAVFMGASSCQKPRKYFDPVANANAELSAKFNLTLCTSRFAPYLKVMARDLLAASLPLEECRHVLDEWLRQYSLSREQFERLSREHWEHGEEYGCWMCDLLFSRPIFGVALELRRSPRGSGYVVMITLNLVLQLEELTLAFRFHLVLPVPRLT
jgi:type VI secretion system protein ImpC